MLLSAGIVGTMLFGPLQAFAADPTIEPVDLKSIHDRGILWIAITHFDIPPFHIRRPDGTFAGKDIDFAHELGQALKVKVVFVDEAPSFDAVIITVAAGRADIGLSKLSQTYDRTEYVRFSQPYTTFRHALLYNRVTISRLGNGRPDEALRDFSGSIGVIGQSAYVDFAAANYPKARIVSFPSWDDTIAALKRGDVDVVYRDEFEVRSVLIQDPAMHIGFGAAVINDRTSFLSVAICNTCQKLEEFINYFIAQHPRTYLLDELLTLNYEK